jgi:hypothetical protein
MKKVLLWLDDIRDPNDVTWKEYFPIVPDKVVWVRSYDEFTEHITKNGLPDAICFDHDLGMEVALTARAKGMSKRASRKLKSQEKTGKDAANWLVNYCLDHDCDLPLYNIQSANPVGKENIDGLLKNFTAFRS